MYKSGMKLFTISNLCKLNNDARVLTPIRCFSFTLSECSVYHVLTLGHAYDCTESCLCCHKFSCSLFLFETYSVFTSTTSTHIRHLINLSFVTETLRVLTTTKACWNMWWNQFASNGWYHFTPPSSLILFILLTNGSSNEFI